MKYFNEKKGKGWENNRPIFHMKWKKEVCRSGKHTPENIIINTH